MTLTCGCVLDLSDHRIQFDVQSFWHGDGDAGVAVADGQVAAGELKVVVLVPVLEGEGGEGRGVGKLQVGKVPVQDLTVSRGQVHITGSIENEQSILLVTLVYILTNWLD